MNLEYFFGRHSVSEKCSPFQPNLVLSAFFTFVNPADPVNEEALSENRKMITNQQLELYNEVAVSVLNGSKHDGRSGVKLVAASRQAALETITQSEDGLHLPESTRKVVRRISSQVMRRAIGRKLYYMLSLYCWVDLTLSVSPQGAMLLMNSACNKLLRPIDGSCCQTLPPLNLLQKLTACFFLGSAVVFAVLHVLGNNRHRRPVPTDVESLEEKKPASAAVPLGQKAPFQALCRMGIIMGYFYLCDRADVFMKEHKFYTHSAFFIPLIYIFVLGIFYSENSKEVSWSRTKTLFLFFFCHSLCACMLLQLQTQAEMCKMSLYVNTPSD